MSGWAGPVMAGGAALGAIGALQAGAAANAAARYNAEIARVTGISNRNLAYVQAGQMEDAAAETLRVGEFNEQQARLRSRLAASEDVAQFAARGIQMDGSALEVLAFNAGQAEIEAQTIRLAAAADATRQRNNARLERWRGDAGLAASQNTQTGLLFEGRQAQTAGALRAGATLLSGAAAFR